MIEINVNGTREKEGVTTHAVFIGRALEILTGDEVQYNLQSYETYNQHPGTGLLDLVKMGIDQMPNNKTVRISDQNNPGETEEVDADPKPCVFCHSRQVEVQKEESMFFVTCNQCATRGPWEATPSDAIEKWNQTPKRR